MGTICNFWHRVHSDAQGWASECPDVKNYKWRLNPVLHRMTCSCIRMATVCVKGLKLSQFLLAGRTNLLAVSQVCVPACCDLPGRRRWRGRWTGSGVRWEAEEDTSTCICPRRAVLTSSEATWTTETTFPAVYNVIKLSLTRLIISLTLTLRGQAALKKMMYRASGRLVTIT